MRDTQTKAIALLSGGLDSTLAVKLMLDQGIAVEALNFHTPFCQCNTRGGCEATRVARELGFPCRTLGMVDAFFERIREPRYGYGSGMNPCLDCRILMFSKAREHMVETGADLVFTGEVVGERPMSQRPDAMRIIERESGLEGYLLRPLSAKLLPPTVAEQRGLVDRERLLGIRGRSRKPQMALAEAHGIDDYPCPAGGCLLTDQGFARRMRDLVEHEPHFDLNDVSLLKVGRHFRLTREAKAVVGRNEGENTRIVALARPGDLLLEVEGWGSPTTLVRGPTGESEAGLAASMTVRYSDAPRRAVVRCRRPEAEPSWDVDADPAGEATLDALRL